VPIKSVLPFIELGFATYFHVLPHHGDHASAVGLRAVSDLFQSGFTYVALCSIAQWIPALRFPGRDTGASLSALTVGGVRRRGRLEALRGRR